MSPINNLNPTPPPNQPSIQVPNPLASINNLIQQHQLGLNTAQNNPLNALLAAALNNNQTNNPNIVAGLLGGLENQLIGQANTAALLAAAHLQSLKNSNNNSSVGANPNANVLNALSAIQMLNDSNVKEKIQALFEQTKKDEERRRKLEEEYKLKVFKSVCI
jgi:hypothetical protein